MDLLQVQARGQAYLIVYGVSGHRSDVDSNIYDTVFVIENGNMVMVADIDMNGNQIKNSTHFFHGILNTKDDNK